MFIWSDGELVEMSASHWSNALTIERKKTKIAWNYRLEPCASRQLHQLNATAFDSFARGLRSEQIKCLFFFFSVCMFFFSMSKTQWTYLFIYWLIAWNQAPTRRIHTHIRIHRIEMCARDELINSKNDFLFVCSFFLAFFSVSLKIEGIR